MANRKKSILCPQKLVINIILRSILLFANNRNDTIDAKILQDKLNLKFNQINMFIKYLEDTSSNVIITTQFEKENVEYFTGIKEKIQSLYK